MGNFKQMFIDWFVNFTVPSQEDPVIHSSCLVSMEMWVVISQIKSFTNKTFPQKSMIALWVLAVEKLDVLYRLSSLLGVNMVYVERSCLFYDIFTHDYYWSCILSNSVDIHIHVVVSFHSPLPLPDPSPSCQEYRWATRSVMLVVMN